MKLTRKTLSDQLYEALKQDIITQKIEFGDKLSNRQLQQKYGVSSTPVRDAINRLYLDGLVENISNSGAKVILFNLQHSLDVNETLMVLCCAAVELSAMRADREKVCKKLEQNIGLQKNAKSAEDYYKYDYQYHKTYFDFCGNRQLQQNYDQYHVLLEMLVRRFHGFQNNQGNATMQHQEIYEAYKAGDVELAAEQTRRHFEDAAHIFQHHME